MSKFFEFTDIDGRLKEAEAYTVSDFVTVATASRPVKTLPSGLLDPSLIPTYSAKAAALVIDRVAFGNIVRGDVVRAHTLNYIAVADPTTTLFNATALGVALNNALDGQNVEVLVLGVITDSIFSVFSVNDHLFLDEDGALTDIRRTTGYSTYIGKHLGGNEVLVSIQPPIKMGA